MRTCRDTKCLSANKHTDQSMTCQKFILETFSTDGHDPDTRGFVIVTGNCSGIQGTHTNHTVRVDKDVQLVGCHFDGYIALAMLGSGDKFFRDMLSTDSFFVLLPLKISVVQSK